MNYKNFARVAAAIILVIAVGISPWLVSPATPCYGQGGYVVDGDTGEPFPGYTWLRDKTDSSGVFTEDAAPKSRDKLCQLTINKGTKALNKLGDPLSSILLTEMIKPPAPAPSAFIGSAYDLKPDGATFDPPITITLTYKEADIPEGVAEENLVVARWDKEAEEWVNLVSTVDPVTNTVSAPLRHFTAFTIIAYTRPAAFTTSALSISPAEVNIGESVTISVTVTNTGDLTGSYEVTLKINDVVIDTKEVTPVGQTSQEVTFTTTEDAAGSYTVNVNGLSDTFIVKPAPAPAPAPPLAPKPTPPPAPAPAPPPAPKPTPPALAPAPPAPLVVPPPAVNWWLIGSIIAGIIIIGAVVWIVVARRRG